MTPQIAGALVRAIELKDASTAAHTWRVTLYARAVAEALKLDHAHIARITTAAALHDVGKIDIPDAILQKPARLSPEEFEIIKQHTVLGHQRLRRMGEDDDILLELVRHHHERWDGLGYPDGVAGEDIPIGARIFSVIDTFDAMTSVRPYRREVGDAAARKAIQEIRDSQGTRYSPDAVDVFVDLFEQGDLDWILHYFNDEASLAGLPIDPEAESVMQSLRQRP